MPDVLNGPARGLRLRVVLWLALIFIIIAPHPGGTTPALPRVTVVFRYDDYSSRSAMALEGKIIQAFQQQGACCTFSVIPAVKAVNYLDPAPQAGIPLTPAKIALARRALAAGAIDVAQHGYSHQTAAYPRGWYTSYAGLDYDSQFYKIKTGKVLLEKMLDTRIVTFVPPFNSYDANTVKALEHLNFQCLAANRRGPTVPGTSIKMLPATCTLAQLRDAVQYAQHHGLNHAIICVMFHQYDFHNIETTVESEKIYPKITFEEFKTLLSWVVARPDVQIRSIGQLLQEKVNLNMARFINNKYYMELYNLKPVWWPPHYDFYLPGNAAFNLNFQKSIFNITLPRLTTLLYLGSFYLIILALFFLIASSIAFIGSMISGKIAGIFKYLSLILAVGLVVALILAEKIGYRKLGMLTAALGLASGVWLSGLVWRKSGAAPAGTDGEAAAGPGQSRP